MGVLLSGAMARAAPTRDATGGEEVIDDPEDRGPRPRPAPARLAPTAPAPVDRSRLLVTGFVSLLAAFDARHEGRRRGVAGDTRAAEDVFELLTRARLAVEARWSARAKVKLEARLEHGVTCERPQEGDFLWLGNGQAWRSRALASLGEAYVDLYTKVVDIRLGQQVVPWGLSELLGPNDVVNPRDLRRPWLLFDEDLRLPVLAARASFHVKDHTFDLVWLPFHTASRTDVYGSDWALLGPGAGPAFAAADRTLDRFLDPTIRDLAQPLLLQTQKPRDDLSASSAGVRWSMSRAGWDVAVQYFLGWDRTPRVRVQEDLMRALVEGDLLVSGALNLAVVTPLLEGRSLLRSTFERTHRLGLSVGKAFQQVALRLDVAYAPDQGFLRTDLALPAPGSGEVDLRVEHHTLTSALGLEYAHGSTVLLQVQVVHLALLDRARSDARVLMGFIDQPHVALALAALRVSLLRDTLLLNLAAAVDLLRGSFALLPGIQYKIRDRFRVGVGAVVVEGRKGTLFGTYDRNDTVFLEGKFSF